MAVISYNMSVFSSYGFYGDTVKSKSTTKPTTDSNIGYYPSEARFLRRATKPREFFKNAMAHLRICSGKLKPVMVGIQEFNPVDERDILDFFDIQRYASIKFDKKITNNASLLTIFDYIKLGNFKFGYHEDLGLTKRENGQNVFNPPTNLPNDGGRPISIIFTDNGYILMNFHGPNRPRLTANGKPTNVEVSDLLKEALNIHLRAAIKAYNTKFNTNTQLSVFLTKLIITCDSNDRAHGINTLSPLTIAEFKFHDGHEKSDGALSAAYNIDSCGFDRIPETPPLTMGKDGAENNYIYTGDYVLSTKFTTPVTAVVSPLDADGASIASDHKLVYAIIPSPISTGGKRKRKYKRKFTRKSRRQNKRRASRRRRH